MLGITIKDILERRLQTIVFKKGLARGIKQARQFVTHQHIAVNDRIITAPSYLVLASEEGKVSFIPKSPLADPEHSERVIEKAKPKPKPAKEKKRKTKKGAKEEKKQEKAVEKKEEKAGKKKRQPKERKKENKEEKKEAKKETKVENNGQK